jgi:hypothetical protein
MKCASVTALRVPICGSIIAIADAQRPENLREVAATADAGLPEDSRSPHLDKRIQILRCTAATLSFLRCVDRRGALDSTRE